MIEIKYVCSNGKEYNLVGDRMRPTSGYFHEYEWKPMTTDQEMGVDVYGFEKEGKTYQITLTFRGPLEERKAKMDEITNCFEYDVVNLSPGRIWFGNYYIDGYIKDMSSKVSGQIWILESTVLIQCGPRNRRKASSRIQQEKAKLMIF